MKTTRRNLIKSAFLLLAGQKLPVKESVKDQRVIVEYTFPKITVTREEIEARATEIKDIKAFIL